MVIAETLVGIQLVKASVSGIKSVIETCSDISEVAHHIDNIFEGHEHIERDIKKKQKPQGRWQAFIGNRLGNEPEGDGTSIAEIAQEEIAKRESLKAQRQMARLLNQRFGHDCWATIIKTRLERIEELKLRRKEQAEKAKDEAFKSKQFWKKVLKEAQNVVILLGVITGMYFFISYACKGCI